jgi:hypothetical protein
VVSPLLCILYYTPRRMSITIRPRSRSTRL